MYITSLQLSCLCIILVWLSVYYASLSSGEAYMDRRLTTNFELLSWNFLCADMFPCEDSKTVSVCPSVCPHPEKRNRPGFVNISPTLVIDTWMERSSRLLQHGNPKNWFFFSKKFEIEIDLYFDLCWRAEIIQVGLNMHLYDDIGDASSSLWGSTSSSFSVWQCLFVAGHHLGTQAQFLFAALPKVHGRRSLQENTFPWVLN